MRVGLHIGKFDWPGGAAQIGPTLAAIATTAEAAGLSSLWVMDHLFQLGEQYGAVHGPVDAPMLEGYSTIAYLAGLTRRISLGLLVTSAFYRHPGILAKTVSTIDVLSGGRAYLGLGAGWFEREARGLGVPFPPLRERFERLEETLQIVRRMWDGDASPFVGRHYQLDEPLNRPAPLRRPGPPILIGGGGERRTLRLVAQYADAWNAVIPSPLDLPEFGVLRAEGEGREARYSLDRLAHKLGVLRRHCEELGRPYESIEKTVVTYLRLGRGGMGPDEAVDLLAALGGLGFSHVIINLPEAHTLEPIELLGRKIAPAVAGLR